MKTSPDRANESYGGVLYLHTSHATQTPAPTGMRSELGNLIGYYTTAGVPADTFYEWHFSRAMEGRITALETGEWLE